MSQQQRMGAQNLMNRRNELRAYLEGARSAVRYTEQDGWKVSDPSGMQQESYTITKVKMTPMERTAYEAEVQQIEKQLGELNIPYSTFKNNDPLGIF